MWFWIFFVLAYFLVIVFTPVAWVRGWRGYALIPIVPFAAFDIAFFVPWDQFISYRGMLLGVLLPVRIGAVVALILLATAERKRGQADGSDV